MKTLAIAILGFSTLAFAADQKLGKDITGGDPLTIAALLEKPDPLVGKTVQVKGKVTEVCDAMGCWMDLADDQGHLLHVDVEPGSVVFPKAAVGHTAIAEGTLEKQVLTRAEVVARAKEEAADAHRKFNPSKIKSGKTIYQLAGTGAVILDAQ